MRYREGEKGRESREEREGEIEGRRERAGEIAGMSIGVGPGDHIIVLGSGRMR